MVQLAMDLRGKALGALKGIIGDPGISGLRNLESDVMDEQSQLHFHRSQLIGTFKKFSSGTSAGNNVKKNEKKLVTENSSTNALSSSVKDSVK